MIRTIEFTRPVSALGRNDWMNQHGIEIHRFRDAEGVLVRLTPIHSKGYGGRCCVEVPAEHLEEFIDALVGVAEGIAALRGRPPP